MNICRVASVPFFVVNHLAGQIRYSVKCGHSVSGVSSPGADVSSFAREAGASFFPLRIERAINPFRDMQTLFGLVRIFRAHRFDIVHSVTPKAGLLTAIAAKIAGVPISVHTFTGQRWAELTGWKAEVLKRCDRIIVELNTRSYADSRSQVELMKLHRIGEKKNIYVLGDGSLGGVDTKRFDPDVWQSRRDGIRAELGIPLRSKVITFVGRVTKDKGICELIDAFDDLSRAVDDVHLILVGPLEQELDPLPERTLEQLRNRENIHYVGYDKIPEKYLAISSLFVLPSYREGFGNVVLEAAAMGIPAVGTRISGLVDSIVDGETGVLVSPKDAEALKKGLLDLLCDDERRTSMGISARKRVIDYFEENAVNSRMNREYEDMHRYCSFNKRK